MGYGKWISGALGWVVGGPIGGLIGFAIGSLFERGAAAGQSGNAGRYYSSGYAAGAPGARNSFLVSLLVLSAAIMKADRKVMRSELDYVKDFIRRNFGEDAVQDALSILKQLLNREINVYEVGTQIRDNMNYSQRLQLFHYLVGIAAADGHVAEDEISMLKTVAGAIGIDARDTDSVLAMYDDGLDSAYRILEIPRTATDEEVKKAYKRMALKHHPDKVSSLGPDVQKAAEEKFKMISQAYDKIKKERGL